MSMKNYKMKVVGSRKNCEAFRDKIPYFTTMSEQGSEGKYEIALFVSNVNAMFRNYMVEASKQLNLEIWACEAEVEEMGTLIKDNGIWYFFTHKIHLKDGNLMSRFKQYDWDIFKGLEIYVYEDDLEEYLTQVKGMDDDNDEMWDIIDEHVNNLNALKSNS